MVAHTRGDKLVELGRYLIRRFTGRIVISNAHTRSDKRSAPCPITWGKIIFPTIVIPGRLGTCKKMHDCTH